MAFAILPVAHVAAVFFSNCCPDTFTVKYESVFLLSVFFFVSDLLDKPCVAAVSKIAQNCRLVLSVKVITMVSPSMDNCLCLMNEFFPVNSIFNLASVLNKQQLGVLDSLRLVMPSFSPVVRNNGPAIGFKAIFAVRSIVTFL